MSVDLNCVSSQLEYIDRLNKTKTNLNKIKNDLNKDGYKFEQDIYKYCELTNENIYQEITKITKELNIYILRNKHLGQV